MKSKTHFRKAFNSPYLSSADIVEPTVLTIKHVELEKDKTNKTKEFFNTAFFVEKELRDGEKLKPMILNATNSKMMRDICESPFINDWLDVRVEIWVDHSVRFGRETVDGLRIREAKPVAPGATDEQLAMIGEYAEAGKVSESIQGWLDDNVLSEERAKVLIKRLQDAK
jgi:hypothetical protein